MSRLWSEELNQLLLPSVVLQNPAMLTLTLYHNLNCLRLLLTMRLFRSPMPHRQTSVCWQYHRSLNRDRIHTDDPLRRLFEARKDSMLKSGDPQSLLLQDLWEMSSCILDMALGKVCRA